MSLQSILAAIVVVAVVPVPALSRSQADEPRWREPYEAGSKAFEAGRYAEAEALFLEAVRRSETFQGLALAASLEGLGRTYGLMERYGEAVSVFQRSMALLERTLGPLDPRLAIALDNLADTFRLDGRYEEAGPLYRRALAVLERTSRPDHPELLRSLNGLAFLAESSGRYEEAVGLYERVLAARWGGPGSQHRVLPALESLAAVLEVSHFTDGELETRLDDFFRNLRAASPPELFYIASSRLLSLEMVGEARQVMRRALEEFPESRLVYAELARVDQKAGSMSEAVRLLEAASEIKGPPGIDPVQDRYQRALIQTEVGNVHVRSGRFDEAIAAYGRALHIMPEAVEPRIALASVFLARDMPDEALTEYTRAVALRPDVSEAHYGMAAVCLRLGRFLEAAKAASDAIAIDPQHQGALYLRARALIGAGRVEEGRRALEAYRRRETEARERGEREMKVWSFNRAAAAAWIDGARPEAVLDMFRQGIEAGLRAAVLYFDLGVVESRLGRHRAAIETFQTLLDLGCCADGDGFLVQRYLWQELGALRDAESVYRHALYLREFDTALRASVADQTYR